VEDDSGVLHLVFIQFKYSQKSAATSLDAKTIREAMSNLVKDRGTLFKVSNPDHSDNLIGGLGVPEERVHLLFLGLRKISPDINKMAASIWLRLVAHEPTYWTGEDDDKPNGSLNKWTIFDLAAECARREISFDGRVNMPEMIEQISSQPQPPLSHLLSLDPPKGDFQGSLIVSNGLEGGRAFFGPSFEALALLFPCFHD
jgi:hypothetical protein